MPSDGSRHDESVDEEKKSQMSKASRLNGVTSEIELGKIPGVQSSKSLGLSD